MRVRRSAGRARARAAQIVVASGLLACCCASNVSAAESALRGDDEPASSGPRIALRSGVALPVGAIYDASGPLSQSVSGYVPVRIDAGLRFARGRFYLGLAGQLAAVFPNACASGATCSGTDARVAAMFAVHLLPDRFADPWLGIGAGFETFSLSRRADGAKVDLAANGLELVDLDLGVDFRPAPRVRLGPVVSATLGRFTSVTVNGAESQDFDPMLHSWILLGIRGAYDL
jgi:hypothetical protein